MRCECCDEPLSNLETTAKFADGRYVNMCKECQGYLPKGTKIVLRRDLINERESTEERELGAEWLREPPFSGDGDYEV